MNLPSDWPSYLTNEKLIEIHLYIDRFITKYPETEFYAKSTYLWPLIDEIDKRELTDEELDKIFPF